MTVITFESTTEENTKLALQFARDHGMNVTTNDHRILTDDDMIFGIGRKATNAELREYFVSTEEDDNEENWISIEELRSKFSNP